VLPAGLSTLRNALVELFADALFPSWYALGVIGKSVE
jgi:hypothetical protein